MDRSAAIADPSARKRRGLARRRALTLALCALCLGGSLAGPTPVHAQAAMEASEEKLEVAYMIKFLNYVEWPPSSFPTPDAPYQIGVVGDDVVADELARAAAGKSVNGRALRIRRLAASDAMDDIDMLFIGRAERARQAALLARLRTQPVLTVTANDGALEAGSIINFRIVDNRVRFEVSLDEAERAQLRLSARLLGVAINVVKGKH